MSKKRQHADEERVEEERTKREKKEIGNSGGEQKILVETSREEHHEKESKDWLEKQQPNHGSALETLLAPHVGNITGIVKIIMEYNPIFYWQSLSTFRMMPVNMFWENLKIVFDRLSKDESTQGKLLKFDDGSIRVDLKDDDMSWLNDVKNKTLIPHCGLVELRCYFPDEAGGDGGLECCIASKCKDFGGGPFAIVDYLQLVEQVGRAFSVVCPDMTLEDIKIENVEIIRGVITITVEPNGSF